MTNKEMYDLRWKRVTDALGFPTPMKGMAAVPFDSYSDFLRGTINGLSDLYIHEEEVQAYIDEEMENQMNFIKMQGQMIPGRCVFMALHKGMDYAKPENVEAMVETVREYGKR